MRSKTDDFVVSLNFNGSAAAIAPPISDEEVAALAERNEQRLRQAKAALGLRYLVHPVNRVPPRPQPLLLSLHAQQVAIDALPFRPSR